MTGRILSEEEIDEKERQLNLMISVQLHSISIEPLWNPIQEQADLIATIRHLQQELERVKNDCSDLVWAIRPGETHYEMLAEYKLKLKRENEVMCEALERYADRTQWFAAELPENNARVVAYRSFAPRTIAEDALAKVKGDENEG